MYRTFSSGLLGFSGRHVREDIPLAIKYGYEGIVFDIKEIFDEFSSTEFSEFLAKNSLLPSCFGLPMNIYQAQDEYDEGLKKLKEYCEYAKKIGATRCTTGVRPGSDTLDYRTNFKMHVEKFTPIARILEEYEICLGFEFIGPYMSRKNRVYEFIHNLDGLNELLVGIGTSNLGYLLDAWHWEMAGQVFEDFRKIPSGKKIVIVHINDAPRGLAREEQDDHNRGLPGETGVLKIDEFFKGLQNLKYDGPVAVEPFSEKVKAMPFEEAVKVAKASMNKVWPK